MDNQKNLLKIGMALCLIWVGIVVYTYLSELSEMLTWNESVFNPWMQIRWATLYIWTPWLLVLPLLFYLAAKFPIVPESGIKTLCIHFALMLFLSVLHSYISAQLYYFIGFMTPEMAQYAAWQHTGHFLFMDNMFLVDAIFYSVLVASQNIQRFVKLVKEQERNAALMQTQLTESKLQALKMQINPHFLFNTLNSVSVLIRKNEVEKADLMLSGLSDFFRMTMEQGLEQVMPLKHELVLIERYLEIEKIRFGERLYVDYQIEKDCLAENIPVLLLQPLVENAIKHGLAKKPGKCCIQISISKVNGELQIIINDDGAGDSSSTIKSGGVGLANIRSRLQSIYKGRASFAFNSSPGKGASVSIRLPFSFQNLAVSS